MPALFTARVLDKLKQIPRGRVTTYGRLARAAGKPKAARAAGTAAGKNQDAPTRPCHRVVRSDGSIGGYSGAGGIKKKIELLKKEGVVVKNGRVENFRRILYTFKANT